MSARSVGQCASCKCVSTRFENDQQSLIFLVPMPVFHKKYQNKINQNKTPFIGNNGHLLSGLHKNIQAGRASSSGQSLSPWHATNSFHWLFNLYIIRKHWTYIYIIHVYLTCTQANFIRRLNFLSCLTTLEIYTLLAIMNKLLKVKRSSLIHSPLWRKHDLQIRAYLLFGPSPKMASSVRSMMPLSGFMSGFGRVVCIIAGPSCPLTWSLFLNVLLSSFSFTASL